MRSICPGTIIPPVTSLTEEDKQKIAALLKTRAEWFQPDFAALYKAIDENESLKVDDVRKAQCLEAVYKAGVRVTAPQAGELNFTTTGGPEVVVTRKNGSLFGLDEKTFAPVKDEETQMCAGMVLSTIYPGRLVVVRKPDGAGKLFTEPWPRVFLVLVIGIRSSLGSITITMHETGARAEKGRLTPLAATVYSPRADRDQTLQPRMVFLVHRREGLSHRTRLPIHRDRCRPGPRGLRGDEGTFRSDLRADPRRRG